MTLMSLDLDWAPSTLPPVCIFNMIDDTIGGGFKPIPNRAWKTLRSVKDIAWDLGARPNNLDHWVQDCPSCMAGNKLITRALAFHEL